jgi:integrase
LVWKIPLFRFAFYTGMRGSEIARLRWNHIDFEKDLIYIREQKNRKEQTIPLNSKAHEVLETVEQEDSEDYVFQSPSFEGKDRNPKWFRENVSDAFRKARRAAGLREGLSFHSLRHGFCTMLAEAGKSAVVIKEAARHADISTSMRYVHMANEQLKTAVEEAF